MLAENAEAADIHRQQSPAAGTHRRRWSFAADVADNLAAQLVQMHRAREWIFLGQAACFEHHL